MTRLFFHNRARGFARAWMCGLFLTGCTNLTPESALQWEPFDDPQQNWPTAPAGLMHCVDAFPIYGADQLPAAPYRVVGMIEVSSTAHAADERAVAKLARANGGEAALITNKRLPAAFPRPEPTDYLVIRFETNSLAPARERLDIFLALTGQSTNDAAMQRIKQSLLARPGGSKPTNTATGQ